MIYIGLTGWGDHDSLYGPHTTARDKLKDYASYFPTVEVDASFYAVQPLRNSQKWVQDTPDGFQFIVKAYQGMTGHERGEIPFDSKRDMFQAFKESLTPYSEAGKLAMVLFQFPPWFDCKRENVSYLRWCKEEMGDFPCALEFRNQSWFTPNLIKQTLQFMRDEKWIHSIRDEPQSGEGSVPTVLQSTHSEKVLVRFHGRNVHGWQKRKDVNWREVRYLYRYNEQELRSWIANIKELQKQSQKVYAVFNNNSGGDAADNGRQFIDMLGIHYDNLAPRQLDLF
ncbi:DUF72 domain-containing protein [Bacillus dakarensis]|uniref:DUF72 domain-containing protein n=1 Tax=Robertmurraya dakarensis TaxID=1926278 RepID=UPI000981B980|nr:DUF72 domain-containing protein [Bacillus dakarensis]